MLGHELGSLPAGRGQNRHPGEEALHRHADIGQRQCGGSVDAVAHPADGGILVAPAAGGAHLALSLIHL